MLLTAYRLGLFPMADGRHSNSLYWLDPRRRGIIPLDGFRVSRRLARTVRQGRFEVHVDGDFDAVIAACAEPRSARATPGSTTTSCVFTGSSIERAPRAVWNAASTGDWRAACTACR